VELPGIGPYTAAAVAVFAFGAKTPMIETNIRSVYLYTFFRGIEQVSDKTLLEVIAHTMYTKDTRAWFYALMDIGVALKKTARGINKQSKHYSAQTPYEGSVRQVRAAVLRFLTSKPASNFESIRNAIAFDQEKLCRAIESLIKDGFLVCEGRDSYSIV
jgi:A/G-specific adenine glycosylase